MAKKGKGCSLKTVKAYKRCVCGGKVVAKSRCGVKKRGKLSKKQVCKPGTTRKVKGKCGCTTRGGGFRYVKASRCKR